MAYDAWTEGYLKAKQSKANKFDPNISIRFERVGNWIVSYLLYRVFSPSRKASRNKTNRCVSLKIKN